MQKPKQTNAQESQLYARYNTQEFVPIVYNKQFDVGRLVHLRGERCQFAPIKSSE